MCLGDFALKFNRTPVIKMLFVVFFTRKDIFAYLKAWGKMKNIKKIYLFIGLLAIAIIITAVSVIFLWRDGETFDDRDRIFAPFS